MGFFLACAVVTVLDDDRDRPWSWEFETARVLPGVGRVHRQLPVRDRPRSGGHAAQVRDLAADLGDDGHRGRLIGHRPADRPAQRHLPERVCPSAGPDGPQADPGTPGRHPHHRLRLPGTPPRDTGHQVAGLAVRDQRLDLQRAERLHRGGDHGYSPGLLAERRCSLGRPPGAPRGGIRTRRDQVRGVDANRLAGGTVGSDLLVHPGGSAGRVGETMAVVLAAGSLPQISSPIRSPRSRR